MSTIENLWNNFYNAVFVSLDPKLKLTIGFGLIVGALVVFVLASRGKGSELIKNWFLFWICVIMLIVGILYITL